MDKDEAALALAYDNFKLMQQYDERKAFRQAVDIYLGEANRNKHPVIECLACRGDSVLAATCTHGQPTKTQE